MAQVKETIQNSLPNQVHHVMESVRRDDAAKKSFYDAWPTLNPKEHHDKVMMVGALFRQLNPTATAEEAIQRIGQVVHAALGLQMPVKGNGAAQPAAPAATPAAPARPFVPAGGGGGRAAPAPNDNDFAQIAEAFLIEDAGGA